MLLLSPTGTPLSTALVEALAAAAPGQALRDVRRRLADCDSWWRRGVLRGLQATHTAGRVHCDVRPSNVIIVPAADGDSVADVAMLVDYGLKKSAAWPCLGDRSFAALGACSNHGCAAAAGLDLFSAALVWLAVAHGSGGSASAPWGSLGDKVHHWLKTVETDAFDAPALRSLGSHLRSLEVLRGTPAPAEYYSWPWPMKADSRVTRAAAAQLGAASADHNE